MGWTTDLLEGLAQHLADQGVGVWRPDSAYQDDETGVFLDALPPDPPRAVMLAHYPVDDHIELAHSTAAVQVRTRAGPVPTDVRDLDDLVFDLLHGLAGVTFGEAHIKQMWRRSSAALGQARDGRDLWERTSNFYCDVTYTTTHRPI